MKGINDSEYQSCISNLGLLEGEEIRLQYICRFVPPVRPNEKRLNLKGLLVFTNDNIIFMEKQGLFNSRYSQRVRLPIVEITGISLKRIGIIGVLALRIFVGIGALSGEYMASGFDGKKVEEVEEEVQKLLTEVRQEKKRIAQEALAKGKAPAMIFCKFCGTRNKSDKSKCVNCFAPLT